MNSQFIYKSFVGTVAICAAFLAAGCSDSDPKVSGVVISIDGLFPGENAKVYLVDNEADVVTETAVGEDGTFELSVPAGSPFALVTDDFDDTTDLWYPTINVDPNILTIDEDVSGVQIHACPEEDHPALLAVSTAAGAALPFGSLSAWTNFLANWDDTTGDRYSITSVDDPHGGILAGFVLQSPPDTFDAGPPFGVLPTFFSQEITLTVAESATFAPLAYTNVFTTFNPDQLIVDQNLTTTFGASMMLPAAATETGVGSSFYFAFGEPTYTGDTIEVGITDNNATRGLDWANTPFTVPVRDDMITLMLFAAIDGDTGVDFAATIAELVADGDLVFPE